MSTEPAAFPARPASDRQPDLGWARSEPARVLRRVAQRLALGPVLNSEVEVESRGAAEIGELAASGGPLIIVANHASHLDTPVLLSTLPPAVRHQTVVVSLGGALFDSGWRRRASALVFNAVRLDTGTQADDLLDAGWNLLLYPEGGRSDDGFLGRFADLAGRLAIAHQVPLVPAGVRGTFAVMPRGRSWPIRLGSDDSRPRISVGYGTALHPGPDADAHQLGAQIAEAVKQLLDEDATTWWQAQRHPRGSAEQTDPPAGSWRRIWQQTQPPGKGGQAEKPTIWLN